MLMDEWTTSQTKKIDWKREAHRIVVTELYLDAGDKWGSAEVYPGTCPV